MADTKVLKTQTEEGKEAIREKGASTPDQGAEQKNSPVSENWAEETIADLDDFIESQGIYIRQ